MSIIFRADVYKRQGLNNALVPITGFSYGARRKDRIAQSLRFGLLDVSVIMAAGILAILLFAPAIVSIFAVSPEIQDICVYALRIICLGYLFSGANIVLQGFYQALGNGIYSLIVSLLRMTVVLMPLALSLIHIFRNRRRHMGIDDVFTPEICDFTITLALHEPDQLFFCLLGVWIAADSNFHFSFLLLLSSVYTAVSYTHLPVLTSRASAAEPLEEASGSGTLSETAFSSADTSSSVVSAASS